MSEIIKIEKNVILKFEDREINLIEVKKSAIENVEQIQVVEMDKL